MPKIFTFIFIACILIGIIQCANKSDPPTSPINNDNNNNPPRELTTNEKELVKSSEKFGLKIFKEVNKIEGSKNIFISPLSISFALGMTYNGANGSTKDSIQSTLEMSNLSLQEINESYKSLIELLTTLDPKVVFQIANSIWYRQGFPIEDDFVNLNKTYFNAQVSGLDFSASNASDIINQWVYNNTNGKISEIVDNPIDPMAVMFLINAIYFKGIWTYKFDPTNTQDDKFTLPNGSLKPCKMMVQKGKFNYFENSDFQAIDLLYGNGKFSMTIFLPHPRKNIDSLIAEFSQDKWNQWINSFSEVELTLMLPKFTLEYDLKLNNILKTLGMEIAFDPDNADFTRMYYEESFGGNLYISNVKHKTFIKVDEEGTEASAVTSVEINYTSLGTIMRVDRPFVFVIRENHSQTILFIGKIVEPL